MPRAGAALVPFAERPHPEAARLARDPRAVALLPLGAVEPHGPHLPLLVDWLGAEVLARRLAPHLRRAGLRPILLPGLPYGVSTLAVGWPGTIALSRAVLARVIVELVRSLAAQGFRRVVLTNYQADPDHLAAIRAARRRLARDRRLTVLVAGFSPDPREMAAMRDPRVARLLRSPRPEREWHGGELETAVVLASRPGLVRRATARRLPPAWADWAGALDRGATAFRDIAPRSRGYFGWPAAARAATGRAALALRARLMARMIVDALARPPR